MFFPMDNKKSHFYLHKIDLINHLTHNGLFKKIITTFRGFWSVEGFFVCLPEWLEGREKDAEGTAVAQV